MKNIFITIMLLGSSMFGLDHTYELTPYVGKNFTDSKLKMNDPTVIGINFDTFFNRNFGVRFGYERLLDMERETNSLAATSVTGNGNSNNGNGSSCNYGMGDDFSMNRVSFNGIFRYPIDNTILIPYIYAGLGSEFCTDGDCSSTWTRNLGLGLGIDVSCNFMIMPEIKVLNRDGKCNGDDESLTDVVATLGLAYKFGKPNIIQKVVTKKIEIPVERIVTRTIEVPVETIIEVETCKIPTKFKDRCDNSYYIQIAGFYLCPTCRPKIRDKELLRKLKNSTYRYSVYAATTKNGDRVGKVLIGPYRCKRDAYKKICEIKKYFKCDAFIYEKLR